MAQMTTATEPVEAPDLSAPLPLEVELEKAQRYLEEAQRRLAVLPDEVHAAKVKARLQAPTKEAFDNRAVRNLQEERRSLEAQVPQLEGEILAIQEAVADEQRARDLALLQEPIADAERLTIEEVALWARGGELLASMVDWYDDLLNVAEARAALHRGAEYALSLVEDPELKARGKAAFRPPVTPWPADFLAAVDALVDVMLDPRRMGRRSESGVMASRALVDVTPDLTSRWCRAELHREEKVYGVERAFV